MKLSLSFYPNELKANRKSGKIPVYLRIMLNRKKAEMRLNVEVHPAELKKWDPVTMRFRDRNLVANAILNKIETKFEDFQYNSTTNLAEYDVKKIRDILMGLNNLPCQTVATYIDKYYESAITPNIQLTKGTKKNYRKALNHLKCFLKVRRTDNILLKDMTVPVAYEFKDYLLGSNKELNKIGLTEPSALDNVKRLRTIFDRAVEEGLVAINPFKKIKLKSKSNKRGRLDIYEVKKLCSLDLTDFPVQQLYRDLFLFSIFTGLSYGDLNNLTHADLYKAADGNVRLFIKRAKTDVITEMILPVHALKIIKKYQSLPELDITKKVLPGRSNKEINVQLKILANMVSIPIKLTTHIARHTYRQLLSEANIQEIAVIKRMMGHSRSSDIDEIYYSVTESRLLEAKNKFDDYLNKNLI
jgi:site-specific recombinase XerD